MLQAGALVVYMKTEMIKRSLLIGTAGACFGGVTGAVLGSGAFGTCLFSAAAVGLLNRICSKNSLGLSIFTAGSLAAGYAKYQSAIVGLSFMRVLMKTLAGPSIKLSFELYV